MNLLALDLETHKIQPGLLAPPIVCASLAWRLPSGETSTALLDKSQGLDRIQELLDVPDTIICGANVAFDFGCLLAARPGLLPGIWKLYEQGRVFDILIAGTLDAIAEGRLMDDGLYLKKGEKVQSGRYSLEVATKDYLGRSNAKANDTYRTSYALLESLPIEQWPQEAQQYPLDDAQNTLEVAEVQRATCKNLQNQSAQAHAAFCAHLGAIWGIKIDAERVEALRESNALLQDSHKAFQRDSGFAKLGGTKAAPKWTKDMAAIRARVLEAYEGRAPKTEKGAVSTSRETLEDSGDPELEKLAAGSKYDKIAVYAETLSELKGKPMNVRCNILLATGRASYEGLIQLMPRQGGVRECCVARPGTVWSSVDYAAIEMSTLAQVQLWTLGRSKLAEAINADTDPHSSFGAMLIGTDYPSFLSAVKGGSSEHRNIRQAAKACLAGGTLTLTDSGWKRLEAVTVADLVWDGNSWVTHSGLIDQGVQETESYHSVEMTPDHEVLTEHGWREWKEVLTSPSLFQSALDLARLPSLAGPESSTTAGQADITRGCDAIVGLNPGPQDTSSRQGTLGDVASATKAPLPRRSISHIEKLFRMLEPEQASWIGSHLQSIDATTLLTRASQTMEGGGSTCTRSGSPTEQHSSDMWRSSQGTTTLRSRWTESTMTEGTSQEIFNSAPHPRISGIGTPSQSFERRSEPLRRSSRVYDLLNAGPNHRFTVLTALGPVVVSNCNFGFPGMMGAAKFVIAKRREGASVCRWTNPKSPCGTKKLWAWKYKELDSPLCAYCLEQAEKLRNAYLRQWPEMRLYWDWVVRKLREGGDSLTQFVSERVRGGLSGPAASNTLFQGLAADGAKAAVVALTKEMYLDTTSPLYGSRLMVFAHDETILEIPEERAHEAAHRQAEIMVDAMRHYVPDVKVKAEPALMKVWSKKAEAVYKDGRLVPWES